MIKRFNRKSRIRLDTEAVTDKDLIDAGFRCLQQSYIRCKIYGWKEWRIFSNMDNSGYYLTHDKIITSEITPIKNKGELKKILEFVKNG